MSLNLNISPHGLPLLEVESGSSMSASESRIIKSFSLSVWNGFLHLATLELQSALPPALQFARHFAGNYLTSFCRLPWTDGQREISPLAPPSSEDLSFLNMQAPPMKGAEYLTADLLAQWWIALDTYIRDDISSYNADVLTYLKEKCPQWRLVGRVMFHLAENKRDAEYPFAFMATYASRLSAQAKLQHQPLSRALQEYAGARNRQGLTALLAPIERASEKSTLAKELLESQDIYRAVKWTPRQAHRFLQELPHIESAGIVVRVPDWWKKQQPPRPQVNVRIGDKKTSGVGADAMLDFSVSVTLDGKTLSPEELQALIADGSGLVALRGKWVEIDRDKLKQALDQWKQAESEARNGTTFFEAMRLISGVPVASVSDAAQSTAVTEWFGITAGQWLSDTLKQMRDPAILHADSPPGLNATLRPYQQTGFAWLRFMSDLGLGACLADDMGLGKTIQVLSLLLHLKSKPLIAGRNAPSLLVVPASLIANWKNEIAKFSPTINTLIAHPSENDAITNRALSEEESQQLLQRYDLVITTYGMLNRMEWLRRPIWRLAILDEAQAIKNSGSQQTRSVKQIKASARIALTGTPIENRMSDLWSLFDFINPGLLGSARDFSAFTKRLAEREQQQYGPLRSLVKPYILRRMKTDRTIISDLPDKTELKTYCGLSKTQAALYEQSVHQLKKEIEETDGIQRRGIVLAFLMRFKQICNHPSQWLGDGAYDPSHSGKFKRLGEIGEELADRQEKVLIFSQFREITSPLHIFLNDIFGRDGLTLHGQTAVGKRRELVESFQRDDGPPFFVLSLKAGGTGLNLTAASHVIHFDRWWNPAVENQATDRAFRIGQKKNVFVHKFVCRGTIEERIDQLIEEKSGLSREILEGGTEKLLTEMNNEELMKFVALDIRRATEN